MTLAHDVRRGAGHRLRFEFLEKSWFEGRFHRTRCVEAKFEVTPYIENTFREWLSGLSDPQPNSIRLTEGATDVIVTWSADRVNRQGRTSSRMPAVAYDLEENPVFTAVRKKADQLKGVPNSYLRCVFLVDVGCSLLRRLQPFGGVWEVSGERIVRHALEKFKLDVICVFSPQRDARPIFGDVTHPYWKVTYFDRRVGLSAVEYDGLHRMAATLPHPRYEGYQARSIHQQGLFGITKNQEYLATEITARCSEMSTTIKVSSRLLQELLAERITSEVFCTQVFQNHGNQFRRELEQGRIIRKISFEDGGIDEDDDCILIDYEPDFSVRPLTLLKK